MKVWVLKTLTGLLPADDECRQALAKIPPGTTIDIDISTRRHRSAAFHRRYWALMSMLAANVEQVEIEPGVTLPITDSESAHVAMKYLTGLFDSYAIQGGVVRLIKSTAFDKMDADQWAKYWLQVLEAVHTKILPGIEIREVEEELARMAS